MEWTTTRPTAPGVHWQRRPGQPPRVIEIPNSTRLHEYWVIGMDIDEDIRDDPPGTEYAGPIHPPA